MQNPFEYTDSNKRYHTYDYDLRKRFGTKICKAVIDAGCTCPNIDGTKGTGGCIYCSDRGSGDFAPSPALSVTEQINEGLALERRKWQDAKCIAYFQPHTNTYAALPVLKARFEEALRHPDVVGLNIATRADCISDACAEYLHELSTRTALTVELGLQSVHDVTANRINRCHSFADFLEGYRKLEGVDVCVHIINGLPGEDHDMMLETCRTLNILHPKCIKIHLLHVLRNTRLADLYLSGDYEPLTLTEYVNIVCDQLEILSPEIVIGRVTGDGAKDQLLAPLYSIKKFVVMNEIDKELVRRDSFQGKFVQNS